ncbi:ABC-2 type transport system permease protein [Microbacterium sp. SORGH_AS 505]|uniref:ABC transporter permease n=1 Tax=Microbacterium sp. SORGH_AS_0505 TaxID=3041770 RepID=UPI002784B977|nr:ABC transporter permease [Microbacterium sp. SORGH_AS_0505]MDQ1125259.1 ABC-2 type transport system permease protein [Microbacterium sp. SORGH_AS_0505]
MSNAIDLSDYDVPGRGRGILDVIRWRYLLSLLVQKGTATRYRNSVLGWTWSYVKPAAQFAVYYFVMGIILGLHQNVPNFAIYLFCGVVMVNLFNEAFTNATDSIVANGSLVRKIYLPRELFPLAAAIGAVIHFLPQAAVLVLICLIAGWSPSLLAIGAALLGIVLVVVWSFGLGLLFAGVNVRFRDAHNFVEIIRTFSTWTSPVLYTWVYVQTALPSWGFHIFMSNPLTVAVELFHVGFWDATVDKGHGLPPHFLVYVVASLVVSLIVMIAGQITFRRFERSFAQDL